MKTKFLITSLLCLFVFQTTEAQFWKKIADRVKESAEETLKRKVEEKAAKETDVMFDKIFNSDGSFLEGNALPPSDSYHFNYEYITHFESEGSSSTLIYLLSTDGEYIGSKLPAGNEETIISVFDQTTKTAHMYLDANGNKSILSLSINMKKMAENAMDASEMEIEKLPETEEILGLLCNSYLIKGKMLDGSFMETKAWVAHEAPTNFSMGLGMPGKSLPNLGEDVKAALDGLVLKMDMYSYELKNNGRKKKEKRYHLECSNFKAIDLTIVSADYQQPEFNMD